MYCIYKTRKRKQGQYEYIHRHSVLILYENVDLTSCVHLTCRSAESPTAAGDVRDAFNVTDSRNHPNRKKEPGNPKEIFQTSGTLTIYVVKNAHYT